jgi:hypothetical protein
MTSTATSSRTFIGEGLEFTTKAKARFAVVLTTTQPIYCSDRGYAVGVLHPNCWAGGVFIAKKTSSLATATKALVRYSKQDGFISGSIVDTETNTTV